MFGACNELRLAILLFALFVLPSPYLQQQLPTTPARNSKLETRKSDRISQLESVDQGN